MGNAQALMRAFEIFVTPPLGSGKYLFYLRPKIAHHLGRKPLSFHSVSFGQDRYAFYLQRMAEIALEIQGEDPELPATVSGPPSTFSNALDTVRTFVH